MKRWNEDGINTLAHGHFETRATNDIIWNEPMDIYSEWDEPPDIL